MGGCPYPTLAAVVALWVALPGCLPAIEDKTACRDSRDCIGNRICNDGACVGAACEALCLRTCEATRACGVNLAACDVTCTDEAPLAAPLSELPREPAACKARWDEATTPSCRELLCQQACTALCDRGKTCGFIDDLDTCVDGCLLHPPADCDAATIPSLECEAIRAEVRCDQARGEAAEDLECRLTPCSDDYDCAPSEACAYDGCRPRCLEDWECPRAACFTDWCTDPVGTPCEQPGCGGAACINEDRNNLTTTYYCTRFCSDSTPCPGEFACVDDECRR